MSRVGTEGVTTKRRSQGTNPQPKAAKEMFKKKRREESRRRTRSGRIEDKKGPKKDMIQK